MRELENRQKFRRRLYSFPVLFILFIVAIGMARGAYLMLIKERESARGAEELALEVSALSERETVLGAAIDKLSTPEGIEEEIKSKFNVARAGEHVAVIVDRPEDAPATSPEKLPWFKRIWSAIIGK